MADQQSNCLHNHENNQDPEPKWESQKQDEKEFGGVNPTEEANEPKSITNIYYDCLERIFDFLDLESLLNVAGTCKRLQIAAAAKFGDNYGNSIVWLRPMNSLGKIRTHGCFLIQVPANRKFCFPFLRCFGAKISKIDSSSYNDRYLQRDHLNRYINRYCSDTLISFNLWHNQEFSNGTFLKPFKNIQKVCVSECDLQDQLANFANWFPNLSHLEINNCSINENALAVPLQNLKHLILDFHGRCHLKYQENSKLLHANPQLQCLNIGNLQMTLESFLDMISENKSILKLETWGLVGHVTIVEINRFVREHPMIEELELLGSLFIDDGAVTLIGQLNYLKRFKFNVKSQTECERFLNQLDAKWKYQVNSPLNSVHRIVEISHSIQ